MLAGERQPTGLRQFFGWARADKLILISPVTGLSVREPRGFRGPTAGLSLQRELFRRWTREPGVHPHEAVTGLLALLHGASSEELRLLTVSGIDPARRAIRLGSRPQPTPLDPASWTAVQRCMRHREDLGGRLVNGAPKGCDLAYRGRGQEFRHVFGCR